MWWAISGIWYELAGLLYADKIMLLCTVHTDSECDWVLGALKNVSYIYLNGRATVQYNEGS